MNEFFISHELILTILLEENDNNNKSNRNGPKFD